MNGIYTLIIKIKEGKKIEIGAIGHVFFKKGYHIYVGSAQSNLEKRIERHLEDEKNLHWHIDYLLSEGEIKEVLALEKGKRWECKLAEKFLEIFEKVEDFGCSDCSCISHLFYSDENLEDICEKIRDSIDEKTYSLKELDLER